MHTYNFPGRKKKRREKALEIIEKYLMDPNHCPKRFKDKETKKSSLDDYKKELKKIAEILKDRIKEHVV